MRFKYSSFRKVVAFRILVGTEWALLVGSSLFPDFEMWRSISARVKKGIRRMSADQPSDGKLKGIWVGQMPGLSSLVLFKRSLRFEYTESGSGSTIIQLQSCPSEARNRRELAVKAQASYLFTNCAFVFNPFNVSPLHFSQKRSSSFFSVAGDLPWREAPGISSSVSAREAAILDDQNTGKSRPH